jgi:hypothetical protein
LGGEIARLLYYLESTRREISLFTGPPRRFLDVTHISQSYQYGFWFDSIAILLLTFKLLEFFKLDRDFHLFFKVFEVAFSGLLVYLGPFILLLIAFALFAHSTFGIIAVNYSSLVSSMITLLTMCLGQFEYVELADVNPFWAPIFFISYTVLVTFIFVRLFKAILNDTYLVEYRYDRKFNPDDGKRFAWMEIMGVFIPSLTPEIVETEKLGMDRAIKTHTEDDDVSDDSDLDVDEDADEEAKYEVHLEK